MAAEWCKKYMSHMMPYATKRWKGEGSSQKIETDLDGDDLSVKVLTFVNECCQSTLELRCEDDTTITLNEYLESAGAINLKKVVLLDCRDAPYGELAALAVLRASVTAIVLAESLDYLSCAGDSSQLDSRYLGTLCGNLEDLIRLNDDICSHESETAVAPTASSEMRSVPRTLEEVINEEPQNQSATVGTSLWSRTHCKQSSASESAFMSFLLDLNAEEILCYLATEVVRRSFADETEATAAVRLSIRFLLIGAEIAMESKIRAQRFPNVQEAIHRFCARCLELAGQSVGSVSSSFPSIDIESWLIAAEDFGEGCSFGTVNIHVPFFCGMIGALERYCSQEPVAPQCKRALLMLLRIMGPAEEAVNRYRKGSRTRSLQSPEQLASQLIGSARTRISLQHVTEGAKKLISKPPPLKDDANNEPLVLAPNASLEEVVRGCGRFVQSKSEDPLYSFLHLLSSVMISGAQHGQKLVDLLTVDEKRPPSPQTESSDAAETQSLLGNMFLEPAASYSDEESSTDKNLRTNMIHLEIVNLSIQGLTALIDFIPRKANPSFYGLYNCSMRTARLLPLEILHSSMSSVLSSRLRTLLVSALRGHQDSEVLSNCHASVINAFVEEGQGGLRDPRGVRHESFFLAYIVLKAEREARRPGEEGPEFVLRFMRSFLNEVEEGMMDFDKTTTITYSTILLVSYAFNSLQSLAQRKSFVKRLSSAIERVVKVMHDNENQSHRHPLQSILTVVSVADYCTSFLHSDRVPLFLEHEIEHEIFRTPKRGVDGSARFQQLMAAQSNSSSSSGSSKGAAANLSAGPTSSSLETLLDTLCEKPWELKIGEHFSNDRNVNLTEFVEVTWRILNRLPRDGDSEQLEIIGGLSSRLNALRAGSQTLNARTLAEIASESITDDIRLKDCIWMTAYLQVLIQRGCEDDAETCKTSLNTILEVTSRLISSHPDLLANEPEEAVLSKGWVGVPIYQTCCFALQSAKNDSGRAALYTMVLSLMEAGVQISANLSSCEGIIWNSAALAAKAVTETRFHGLLRQIAQNAGASQLQSCGINTVDVVFHAHRIALAAKDMDKSDVNMESWLTLLETGCSVPNDDSLGDLAAAYVFGGIENEQISRLLPQCSLKDTMLQVAEDGSDISASRMLEALLKLARAPQGSGWTTSVQKAVFEIAQNEDAFTRITTKILPSAKAASSMVSLFETTTALGEEVAVKAIRALARNVADPCTSSACLLHTIDLMLVLASKETGEATANKLVETYYELITNFWDEKRLHPQVLEAKLKSCMLLQRIARLLEGFDADQSFVEQEDVRSNYAETLETEEGSSTPIALSSQNESAQAEDEEELVDGSDDNDTDEYSPERMASRCCTFTETGRQFVEQHWYYCYTCGMTWGEGICGICALVCHKDHEISYSRLSRFFCDCGAGASDTSNAARRGNAPVTTCLALQPRLHATDSRPKEQERLDLVEDMQTIDESALGGVDGEQSPTKLQSELPTIWSDDDDTKRRMLKLFVNLSNADDLLQRMRKGILEPANARKLVVAARSVFEFGEGRLLVSGMLDLMLRHRDRGEVETRKDIVELRSSARAGTVILRKAEPRSETDVHISGSLLAYNGCGIVSAVDPGGKLSILDVKPLLSGNDVTLDGSNLRTLSQVDIPAGITYVEANDESPHDLALSGCETVLYVRVDEKHDIQQKIYVEIGVDDGQEVGTRLIRASWVKGLRNLLAVTCPNFVKVFNVTEDVLSPVKFLTLPAGTNDCITDSISFSSSVSGQTDAVDLHRRRYTVVCITMDGGLYTTTVVDGSDGPQVLTPITSLEAYGGMPVSIMFSKWSSCVWVVLESGEMVLLRYDYEKNSFTGRMCFDPVFPESRGVFMESLDGADYFMNLATTPNGAKMFKAFRFTNTILHHQTLCPAIPNTAKPVGAVMCEASEQGTPDRPSALLLLEDGSLHRYVLLAKGGVSLPSRPGFSAISGQVVADADEPEILPPKVGFFEHCRSMCDQVNLGGDILNCNGGMTSEEAKLALWGPGADCMVAPTPNMPFKIQISSRIRTVVIVGGSRRWVDMPFTVPESLSAPRDVTIELEPHKDRASDGCCAFDSLDVYCVRFSEFARTRKAYERKVAKLKREKQRIQKKAMQRQHIEDQARTTALKNRRSAEEIVALSVIRVAGKDPILLPEFLKMYVELEHAQGRGTRVRNRCKEVLASVYKTEDELRRAVSVAAMERLYSQAVRTTRFHLFAPRDAEEIILEMSQQAVENFTCFKEFLTGKGVVAFCHTMFSLHETVQHSGRRILCRGKDFTVSLVNLLYAASKTMEKEQDVEQVALILFILLSNENEEVRQVTSSRLSEIVTAATGGDDDSEVPSTMLFEKLIKAIVAYWTSQSSRRMGLSFFDSLSFLHRLMTTAKSNEKVLRLLHEGKDLKACLSDSLKNIEVWQGQPQATFNESFLLLRLFSVTSGDESLEEDFRKKMFWEEELFCACSKLLDRLRSQIEETFSIFASGDIARNDLDDDSAELPRAAHFSSDYILEPLLPRDVCENVLLVSRSNVQSSCALLTVETTLQLLRNLWPLRWTVPAETVDQLRGSACVYAHLFKHKAQNLNSFWTSTVKSTSRIAKNLLLILCEHDKSRYYSELDRFFYWQRLKCLRDVVENQLEMNQEVRYDEQVGMAEALTGMLGLAVKRPWNWRTFCRTDRHEPRLAKDILLTVARSFESPLQLYCIQLLAGAFAASDEYASLTLRKSSENQPVMPSAMQAPDRTIEVDESQWMRTDGMGLNGLIQDFCLGSSSRDVRLAATEILQGLFLCSKYSNEAFHWQMHSLLLTWVPTMAARGRHGAELSDFLSFTVHHSIDNPSYCKAVALAILSAFRGTLEFLSAHPNAHLYKALAEVLILDGHFLEFDACLACTSLAEDVGSKMTRLENIRAEAKYTDRAILCRLQSQQAVSGVALKVVHMGRSCRARTINIMYSCRAVTEVSELKSFDHPWKKSKSITLGLRQSDALVYFRIPVIASNLMFEFAEFHATDGDGAALNERLSCPRCSRTVSDRHGICRNCHENAYQCRQCRNINYENLDAFICNECGYCKHGKFEFSVQCRPSHTAERISTEADRLRTVEMIEDEINSVHKHCEHLKALRGTIQKFVKNPFDAEHAIELVGDLADLSETDRSQVDNEVDAESPLAALLTRIANDEATVLDGVTVAGIERSVGVGGGGGGASNSGNSRGTGNGGTVIGSFARRAASTATPVVTSRVNEKTAILASLYGRDCASAYHSLSKSIQALTAMRRELLRYSSSPSVDRHVNVVGTNETARCFGCAQKFVSKCVETLYDLAMASEAAQLLFVEQNLGLQFLQSNEILRLCGTSHVVSRKLVSHLAATSPVALSAMMDRLAQKLEFYTAVVQPLDVGAVVTEDMSILERLSTSENCCWEEQFSTKLLPLFYRAGEMKSAALAEHVVLPFVRILEHVATANDTEESPTSQLDEVLEESDFTTWGIQILLRSPSADVRKTASNVLKALNSGDVDKSIAFIRRLSGVPLAVASHVAEDSAQYFGLLEQMIESEAIRQQLCREGFLSRLGERIAVEAASLEDAEARLDRFRFSHGFVLRQLVGLLNKTLNSHADGEFMQDRFALIPFVVKAYLAVRALVVQRTKFTDECASELLALLSGMDQLGGKREVLQVFINEAIKANRDGAKTSVTILLDQLSELLCPAPHEPVYNLVLSKSPTQEEFIRGNLSRSSYPSSAIGTIMRDVKNKICRDLELIGLLEDDFGLELLVAGNLLTLDLSIRSVYENIWKPSQARTQYLQEVGQSSFSETDAPMVVVYRLSGLDGEATEPIVDNLPEPVDEQVDPEVEFASTAIFVEYGGLEVLLSILKGVKSWSVEEMAVTTPALKLLDACCQLRSNRLLLTEKESLRALLECSAGAFSADTAEAVTSAEMMLSTCAKVLSEYKEAKDENGEAETVQLEREDVLMLLERFLGRLDQSASSGAETKLLCVLPIICRGILEAQETLINYFLERHDFSKVDSERTQKISMRIYQVLNATSTSRDEYIRFKLLNDGLGTSIGEYLKKQFPYPRSEHISDWNDSLCLQGPVVALRLLEGLTGSLQSMSTSYQNEITSCMSNLLPILTTLETVTSASAIGAVAEELLEAVNVLPNIQAQVKSLRQEIKDSRKAAAAARRNAVLQEAGVITVEEASTMTLPLQLSAASVPECIRDEGLEEEVGPTCVICRDGFCSRPSEVLALYVYNKRISVNAGETKGDDDSASDSSATTSSSDHLNHIYTTVTHFHAIHVSCHREAVRVDRSMRQPRDEWEGATVRNSQTKCNNLFPIQPPAVFEERSPGGGQSKSRKTAERAFADAVEQYFLRMHTLGGSGLSQLQLTIHDLARSLARFAYGDATLFSKDTRGGGPHSNMSLIPYFVQLALYLAEKHADEDTALMDSLKNYLEQGGEVCAYYISMAVCLESLECWYENGGKFLARAIQELGTTQGLSLVAFTHAVQVHLKSGSKMGDWRQVFRQQVIYDEELTTAVKKLVSVHEKRSKLSSATLFLDAIDECHQSADEKEAAKATFRIGLTSLESV